MPHHSIYGIPPVALMSPDAQNLEEFTTNLDWDNIDESLSHHFLNYYTYGVSVLSVTEPSEEHRSSGLTVEKIRVFKRALDEANVRFTGARYTWVPENDLEVDYAHDLDDEMPFTEALAALERIRNNCHE